MSGSFIPGGWSFDPSLIVSSKCSTLLQLPANDNLGDNLDDFQSMIIRRTNSDTGLSNQRSANYRDKWWPQASWPADA